MKIPYVAALAMLAAAPVAAQMATPTPAEFVSKAGASDLYEKQSSQLVLATTKNQAIRRFATMMVSDHNKSTADVKAAATRAGVKPRPPVLDAEQSKMVADLRVASGTARDQLYLQQQATAHQKALALHSGYAQNGTAAPLKAAAAKIAPVVQHHIDTLPTG